MLNQAIALAPETTVAERPRGHKAELRLWLRLLTCELMFEGEIRKRLRDRFSVTLPCFDLMAQLDRAPGGMALSELSQRMTMSNENVPELVERLVAQGLISRRASATDGRCQLINLTTEGRKIFRAMARENGEWISEILADLSSCEIDELTRLLAKVKSSAHMAIAGIPEP